MRRLGWQARSRFGCDHKLTQAALVAEITMDQADIDHALRLLDSMGGIAGRHARASFYRR